MIKEKSCGAVVYKKEGDRYLFLLEKMRLGHISLPKGHMEDGESEYDTALREIKEETNLDVDLDTGFRSVISYSPYDGCIKDVVFFVAELKREQEMLAQECEVNALMWKELNEAIALLTFESDRNTLAEAYKYLTIDKGAVQNEA